MSDGKPEMVIKAKKLHLFGHCHGQVRPVRSGKQGRDKYCD